MFRVTDRVSTKLKSLPDEPGCYLMRDAAGRIIYVGKAVSLRKRVQSYFRQSTYAKAPPKLRGLIRSVADIDVVVAANEAEALLTEGRMIKEYKPRYNAYFKDDKRFLLIRTDPRQPFPSFSFCRMTRDDGWMYFGPFVSSSSVRTAIEFIERRFGLRKCRPRVPDEETHRHCLDDIIRFCSAPCIGKVSQAQYHERFNEAVELLRGRRPQYLKELSCQMKEAAARRDYERAAVIRDLIGDLRDVTLRQSRMLPSPAMKSDEALEGIRELKQVLALKRVPAVIEAFDISNISGTLAVASMVCAVDGVPFRKKYRRFRIKTVEGIDDAAMIHEVVKRRVAGIKEEGSPRPDLIMVDGGAAQLNAGCRALEELGETQIDIIGLAKRFEEIYLPGTAAAVRLSRDKGGLKVLRRLRDEAHRFALEYHRSLRSRRVRESLLDDIEGVGPSRKTALLSAFGSVKRIRKASQDEIASVPGIGYKLAGDILSVLNAAEQRVE